MTIVFWSTLVFLLYTFFGYWILLWIASWFRRQAHHRAAIYPSVSMIVAAYNEAGTIRSKLQNCFELTYPIEKMELIIASDGSTDSTAEIVRSVSDGRVRLLELPARLGKHHAQMMARDIAKGEILVFSDSSIHLDRDALEIIVSNFADSAVGCVSSRDHVVEKDPSSPGESTYIRFEMWLRQLETDVGSLVGVSGSFFAARRELCDVWHPGQSSDFFIPLHAAQRRMRAVLDSNSIGHYGLTRSERAEFHRKVRTIVHGLDVLFTHLSLLNPFRYGVFSWQLASHKLFRWLAPFATLGLLLSSMFLLEHGSVYRIAFLFQVSLYVAGALALLPGPLGRVRPLHLLGFFLLSNVATLTAWYKFGMGERFVTWQPTQRS